MAVFLGWENDVHTCLARKDCDCETDFVGESV